MSEGQSARERLRVGGTGAIQINTAQDAIDFATWCYESGYLPAHVKNAKQAFTIMQRGAEMGLPPFASWRYIYQTKGGKLALESKGALAVCQSKPSFEDYQERIEGDGEAMRGVAIATRKGRKPTIKEFTFADAKAAGLTRRPKSREGREYDGPWQSYLKDMLLSKARERALSIAFAAELGGIPIEGLAEEIEAREIQRGETRRDLKQHLNRLTEGQQRALPEGKPRETLVDLIRGKDFVAAPSLPVTPAGELPSTKDPVEELISQQVDEALGDHDPEPEEELVEVENPDPTEETAECQGCGTVYHSSRAGCPECGLAQGAAPGPPAAAPEPPPQETSESPFARALRAKAKKRMEANAEGQGEMFGYEEE